MNVRPETIATVQARLAPSYPLHQSCVIGELLTKAIIQLRVNLWKPVQMWKVISQIQVTLKQFVMRSTLILVSCGGVYVSTTLFNAGAVGTCFNGELFLGPRVK